MNTIQEAVKYQYGEAEIGISVFMDDVAVAGTAVNIRKVIQNCRRMDIEKKMINSVRKTKLLLSMAC